VRHPAVSGVVGRFLIFAGLARFMISAHEEYAIVRSGRERQVYDNVGSSSRNSDDTVMAEESNDSTDSCQFDPNHGQQENCGSDRTVYEKQHNYDHCDYHVASTRGVWDLLP